MLVNVYLENSTLLKHQGDNQMTWLKLLYADMAMYLQKFASLFDDKFV